MSVFYSATRNGFYPDEFRADYEAAGTWPYDATEISARWYQHLLDGQMKGRIITPNDYGQPVLSSPPPPTPGECIQAAEQKKQTLQAEATTVITPLQDAVDLGIATGDEQAQLTAWKTYRVMLNRVDTRKPAWPQRPSDTGAAHDD